MATVTAIMIATAAAVGTVAMIVAVIMAGTAVATMVGETTIVVAGPSGAGITASASATDARIGRSVSAPITTDNPNPLRKFGLSPVR